MKINYKCKELPIEVLITNYFSSIGIELCTHTNVDYKSWKGKKGSFYGLKKHFLAYSSWNNKIDLSEGIEKVKQFIDKHENKV